MALIPQNFKVKNLIRSCMTFSTFLFGNVRNFQNNFNISKRFIDLWYPKKEQKLKIFKAGDVYCESSCRRRLPACPPVAHTNEASKCLEEGYGKPIKRKRKSWLRLSKFPPEVKQKPTHNPPLICEKEETLKEYIFGPEKPPQDVSKRICKEDMVYRMKNMCLEPRLTDPNYSQTPGDVYLYTEPQEIVTQYVYEPRPINPTPYKPPIAVINKNFSECYNQIGCAAPCAILKTDPCTTAKCPIHDNAFQTPYKEMRPSNPEKKSFTCKQGIHSKDVKKPPRRESCTCVHSAFLKKASYTVCKESCAYHQAQDLRDQIIKGIPFHEHTHEKMSRCERIKLITMEKKLKGGITYFRKSLKCESEHTCSLGCRLKK